jgi:cytoskeletal protein CcmA (bactofilin family)
MAAKTDNPNCVIGDGSIFDGRFSVNGSILIEGKFTGDIRTDDQVIVGPSGKVRTDIVARRVTVAGTLIGNIAASEEVTLLRTGKVLGNISTPKLTVEPGVITEGKVTITSGQAEDAKKIIEDSFGPAPDEAFTAAARERKRERAKEKDRDEPSK